MRIFNENKKDNEIILLLNHQEVKKIIKALATVVQLFPKKYSFKKLLDKIDNEAGIY